MTEPRWMGDRGRPYRVPLSSDAQPAAVVAALDPADRPGVLWGDWFGGGVVVVRRPLRTLEPGTAAEAFTGLAAQPDLAEPPPELVGGGWLTVLGYSPGSTTTAFFDSLLRWRPGSGWAFETLGLAGREAADAAALEHWRRALCQPPTSPRTANRLPGSDPDVRSLLAVWRAARTGPTTSARSRR